MSALTESVIINAAVLTVVAESDLGPARRITGFRIARPFLTAVLIVPFFIRGVAFTGAGALIELAGVAAGLVVGWAATTQMTVYRQDGTGRAVTAAGWGYAAIWIVVSAARVLFSYGSGHWFADPLGTWLSDNGIGASSLTDALIFMALAMVLTRVGVMWLRARRLPPASGGVAEDEPNLSAQDALDLLAARVATRLDRSSRFDRRRERRERRGR